MKTELEKALSYLVHNEGFEPALEVLAAACRTEADFWLGRYSDNPMATMWEERAQAVEELIAAKKRGNHETIK